LRGGSVPGPVTPSGFAVADFFEVRADGTLSRRGQDGDGLLGNDRLLAGDEPLTAIPTIGASRWGVGFRVGVDGGFTYGMSESEVGGESLEKVFEGLLAGEVLVDEFEYSQTTADGKTSRGVVYVTIRGVNNPPSAERDVPRDDKGIRRELFLRASTIASVNLEVLLLNDSDPDRNDVLRVVGVVATSELGAVVRLEQSRIVYDPTAVALLQNLAAGERRTDRVTYTIEDESGARDSAEIEFTVLSRHNVSPQAEPDVYGADEDTGGAAGAFDPTRFVDGDLVQSVELARKLWGRSDPLSAFLWNSLTTPTRDAIEAYFGEGLDGPTPLGGKLVQDLNDIIDGPSLHSDSLFAGIPLGEETSSLLATTPAGWEERRLNLLLLLDAYPRELKKGSGIPGLLAKTWDPDRMPGDTGLVILEESRLSSKGGEVVIHSNGAFEYSTRLIPNIDALSIGDTREDEFRFTLLDGSAGSSLVDVPVLIRGANDAPVAGPDSFDDANEDDVYGGSGLLNNDRDVDASDSLQVDVERSDTESAEGAIVAVAPGGSFTYDPSEAFDHLPQNVTAQDRFSYAVTDGRGFSRATVTLVVTGRNDVPVAVDEGIDKGFATLAYLPLVIAKEYGVLGNDKDVDDGEQALLKVLVGSEDPETYLEGATLRGGVYRIWSDGRFTYDPRDSAEIQTAAAQGEDLIDSFTYLIKDPNNAVSAVPAKVTIVVKATEPYYDFEVVAKTGKDSFQRLGRGPSINNLGQVAFQGTNEFGVDSIYIWDRETGYRSLVSPGMLTGDPPLLPTRSDDHAQVPGAWFSDEVQINDDGWVFAQRQMNVLGLTGILPMGLPVLTQAPFLLTYAELWNGAKVLEEGVRDLPTQIAVGDMGVSGAGLRWGNPLFLDMQLAALTSVMPGMVGFAATAPFTMIPRAWVVNPVWASVWFSPVDPAWMTGLTPEQGRDFQTVAYNALRWYSENPFAVVYAGGSVNNKGKTAFPVQLGPQYGREYNMVTGLHEFANGITQLGVGTTNFIAAPKIADNGRIVVRAGGNGRPARLYSLPFDLNPAGWRILAAPGTEGQPGFSEIGPHPAISDDGALVVFTGVHDTLGRGLFIADPETGKISKVAGESVDGHLDPGEEHVDLDGNGQFNTSDQFGAEDFGPFKEIPIDDPNLDAHLGINKIDKDREFALTRYAISLIVAANGSGIADGNRLVTLEIRPGPNWEENGQPSYLQLRSVLQTGQIVPGIGLINKIHVFDSVSENNQVTFWVEGNLEGDQGGAASGRQIQAVVHGNHWEVDVDVDSNNDGSIDDDNQIVEGDDEIENDPDRIGAALGIANHDDDVDGVPDYADGLVLGWAEPATIQPAPTSPYLKVRLTLPDSVDIEAAEFVFVYSASDPGAVLRAIRSDGTVEYSPAPGLIRLWSIPVTEVRDPRDFLEGGNYISGNLDPNQARRYPVSDLLHGERTGYVYLENVNGTSGSSVDQNSADRAAHGDQPSESELIWDFALELQADPDGLAGPRQSGHVDVTGGQCFSISISGGLSQYSGDAQDAVFRRRNMGDGEHTAPQISFVLPEDPLNRFGAEPFVAIRYKGQLVAEAPAHWDRNRSQYVCVWNWDHLVGPWAEFGADYLPIGEYTAEGMLRNGDGTSRPVTTQAKLWVIAPLPLAPGLSADEKNAFLYDDKGLRDEMTVYFGSFDQSFVTGKDIAGRPIDSWQGYSVGVKYHLDPFREITFDHALKALGHEFVPSQPADVVKAMTWYVGSKLVANPGEQPGYVSYKGEGVGNPALIGEFFATEILRKIDVKSTSGAGAPVGAQCAEHAVLLTALLRSVGIAAHPVTIDWFRQTRVSKNSAEMNPTWQFHTVVEAYLDNDWKVIDVYGNPNAVPMSRLKYGEIYDKKVADMVIYAGPSWLEKDVSAVAWTAREKDRDVWFEFQYGQTRTSPANELELKGAPATHWSDTMVPGRYIAPDRWDGYWVKDLSEAYWGKKATDPRSETPENGGDTPLLPMLGDEGVDAAASGVSIRLDGINAVVDRGGSAIVTVSIRNSEGTEKRLPVYVELIGVPMEGTKVAREHSLVLQSLEVVVPPYGMIQEEIDVALPTETEPGMRYLIRGLAGQDEDEVGVVFPDLMQAVLRVTGVAVEGEVFAAVLEVSAWEGREEENLVVRLVPSDGRLAMVGEDVAVIDRLAPGERVEIPWRLRAMESSVSEVFVMIEQGGKLLEIAAFPVTVMSSPGVKVLPGSSVVYAAGGDRLRTSVAFALYNFGGTSASGISAKLVSDVGSELENGFWEDLIIGPGDLVGFLTVAEFVAQESTILEILVERNGSVIERAFLLIEVKDIGAIGD
jgi:VCBS repeat-containing protein